MRINKPSFITLLLLAASIVISGCGKKGTEGTSKADTQVVAKVNGDEISIHQVNFQLSQLGALNEEQGKAAAKQVVARLVDQQLLKQKAVEFKLDRDPKVLQAIEASKDQILAQAYLEQEMVKAAKPSAAEVDKFYSDHPELFQNRRVFKLQEIAIEVSKEKLPEIQQALEGKKKVNEFAEWLKSKNYKFSANANVRAAEELPSPLLQKIQTLKDGEMVVLPNEHSINVIHIAASQSQPIAKDKAVPLIERYFLNQNKTALAKKQMEILTKAAKIEYIGPFAEMQTGSSATAQVQEVKSGEKTISKKEEVPSSAANKGKDANQSVMDKGLAGL
jgi:EpsD family peptidyl-prolyl cis-trans isomerase